MNESTLAGKKELLFAGNLIRLEDHARNKKKGAKIILGGDLVIYSTSILQPGAGFVRQADRTFGGGLGNKKSKKIYVWISREALTLCEKLNVLSPVLLLDYLIYWSSKRKDNDFIALCGLTGAEGSVVSLLHIKKGELISLMEKNLPFSDSPQFNPSVLSIVEKLKVDYPDANLYWMAPLPDVVNSPCLPVGKEVYLKSVGSRITFGTAPSFMAQHGLSLVIMVVSCICYATALALPWKKYYAASADFELASANFHAELDYASDLLKTMQERRAFLESSNSNVALINKFEDSLNIAANKGYALKEAKLLLVKPPSQEGSAPVFNFGLLLEDATVKDTSVLDQSEPIISSLSESIGTSLHLVKDGTSSGTETIPVRTFRIEGDLNGN